MGWPAVFAELLAHAAQVGGAGVFGLVDAVAEAGDLLLGGEHVLHVFDGVGAGLVDGVEQAHHGFIGAAVQRALERADGAGDGGVNVGEGGGDDAGGEGGGVQFVVGVQDEGDVESAGGGLGGLFAVEHPQEVAGVGEGAVGRNDFEALADAVVDGDDHGDLRGEVVGLAHVGVVRVVLFVGVVEAERRHGSSQHLHRRGGGGKGAQQVDDALVEGAGQGQLRREFAQLEFAGQAAVPEQVGGLLEAGVLGQLVDVDAAIGEHARFSVNPADSGVGGNNSFKTLTSDSSGHSL